MHASLWEVKIKLKLLRVFSQSFDILPFQDQSVIVENLERAIGLMKIAKALKMVISIHFVKI
jgi:hypothetical protein